MALLLGVMAPLVGIPLMVIMMYLKAIREHQATTMAEITRRIDTMGPAVESAQEILLLKPDWDGEGSPGYERATLDRAVEFLRSVASFAVDTWRAEIPPPSIDPGPDGTIDLHWKSTSAELLINISDDPQERATFYGDDYGSCAVRGDIDLATPEHESLVLLSWLLKKHS